MHILFNIRFFKFFRYTYNLCAFGPNRFSTNPCIRFSSSKHDKHSIGKFIRFCSKNARRVNKLESMYKWVCLFVCMTTIWTKISTDEACLRIDFSRIEHLVLAANLLIIPHTKSTGGSFWFITKSCSNRYIRSNFQPAHLNDFINQTRVRVCADMGACVHECIGSMSKLILNCKNPICSARRMDWWYVCLARCVDRSYAIVKLSLSGVLVFVTVMSGKSK